MSYRLEREEPLADGIRRIVVEQVDIAIDALGNPRGKGGVDPAVHEARKAFKRTRSALRLARRVFGEKRFRRENARFRELGRSLSQPRESAVAVLTIDALSDQFAGVLRPGAFRELRAHFAESRCAALWQTVERDEALIRGSNRLLKARRRLSRMPARDSSDLAWTVGFEEVYRRGRRLMSQASREGSPELFHEWRKQAKHLRYHLDILRGAWVGQLDAAGRLIHTLTDVLGLHHDLSDLRRQLQERAATRSTHRRRMESEVLRVLIDGKRVELESRALELVAPIYSRKAKGVVERVLTCWKDWRDGM